MHKLSFIFVVLFVLGLLVVRICGGKDQHYNISQAQWEKEYKGGNWNYLDRVGIERARNSIIVNMFYAHYGGGAYGSLRSGLDVNDKGGVVERILDIGCGLGTLSDYLHGPQRKVYQGVDLSDEAIRIARQIRAQPSSTSGNNNNNDMTLAPLESHQFMQSDAMSFKPPSNVKYGTIVFNEMLYYVDHKKVMNYYTQWLQPNGLIVISVWFNPKYKELRDTIFADAQQMFKSVDHVEMMGTTFTGKKNGQGRMKVGFHVEAFRPN
jgi:2-polyprenyl-3-methyl-5-hydroxy-6-metoxy-1,4-benzoquinol methylase